MAPQGRKQLSSEVDQLDLSRSWRPRDSDIVRKQDFADRIAELVVGYASDPSQLPEGWLIHS